MEQIEKLLEIISKSHEWKNWYPRFKKHKNFKYVDFHLDTRDMQIWSVTFRDADGKKTFEVENKEDFEKILKWLER